jgi:hypothetical protein
MPEPPDQPVVAARSPLGGSLRILAALILLSLPSAANGDSKGSNAPPPHPDGGRTDHGITADDSPAARTPVPPDAPAALPPSDGRQLGQPLSAEEERRAIDNGWQP